MMMNRRGLVFLVLLLWGHTASAGLTSKQKKAILNQHNQFRGSIPRASNMVKLEWNKELAKKAQVWADRCIMDHNPDHSTNKFDWVGENIAFASYSNPLEMVEMWEGEGAIYDYNNDQCNPHRRDPLLQACGHYTQMVWGDTKYLGCGFKKGCSGSMPNRLVCNYGDGGNWLGEKPYTTGKKCSNCPRGYKKCTPDGLCSK